MNCEVTVPNNFQSKTVGGGGQYRGTPVEGLHRTQHYYKGTRKYEGLRANMIHIVGVVDRGRTLGRLHKEGGGGTHIEGTKQGKVSRVPEGGAIANGEER